MKIILITGSLGFIGRAICKKLSCQYKIIALDNDSYSHNKNTYISIKADIEDQNSLQEICIKYLPDVIIHCAGIAHQKISRSDSDAYFRVNSDSTVNLAKAAIKANPNVHFLFLSSISVYGEDNVAGFVSENGVCHPSSDYAKSKLDAEKRLIKLHDDDLLKKLDILRLAPVYDAKWSLNLDRRVLVFGKIAYLQFGSGDQEMSAVARQNLVDFIGYRLTQERNSVINQSFYNIFNVCDTPPYKFKEIIKIFKQSDYKPNRFTVWAPLSLVFLATRIAGFIFTGKQKWFYSCYDKLACSLIFDNTKMLETGFKPEYGLKSVFLKNE